MSFHMRLDDRTLAFHENCPESLRVADGDLPIRDRILAFLKTCPDGADDDEIAIALNLSHRQTANAYCRKMAEEGLILRIKVNGKIRNYLAANGPEVPEPEPEPLNGRPWHWEGNVQESVIKYLEQLGYTITRCCDTASRERGKDIEAQKDGQLLWVTVKGYPNGTVRTRASTQAGHWFKQALFDIIAWRGESSETDLVLALPDFPRYGKLFEKVRWLQNLARFAVFWVSKDGSVIAELA